MSSYGSTEEIMRKIRDGILKTVEKDASKNAHFDDVKDVNTDGTVTILPYVACRHCKKVLGYDKVKGGTSHLRRHADACCCSTSQVATRGIAGYFKSPSVPSSVKSDITVKCVEFICKDIRPFETVAGAGFVQLAQAFVNIGAKYGQIAINDVIPHPTTVLRKVSEVANNLKETVVKPDIQACLNKWGGAVTTDMWTESYTQTSYITVTVHYITDKWVLVERVLTTREFSPDLRHTGENINKAVCDILAEFEVDANKVVFVTDRGANVLAVMREWKHISCCDHMINTVLTHLFNNDSLDDCPRVRSLLTGAKELVRFFKKSGLMKHLSSSLKQEVSTRWNTMFYLLDSIQRNFDEIEHILRTRGEGY